MPTDPTIPYPPRYRWLKRLTIFYASLFAGVLVLRLWWGWDAQRKYDAVVAEIRARGEPLQYADLNDPLVPDTDNAVPLLIKAESDVVDLTEAQANWASNFAYVKRLRPADLPMIREVVSASAKAIATANTAATRPAIAWPPRAGPAWRPRGSDLEEAVSRLNLALLLALEEKRSADALRFTRSILQISRAIDGHPPTWHSKRRAVTAEWTMFQLFHHRLNGIVVDESSPSSATPAQIRSMIVLLEDEAEVIRSAKKMYSGENVGVIAWANSDEKPWIFRPVIVAGAAGAMGFLNRRITGTVANYHAAMEPPVPQADRSFNAFTQFTSSREINGYLGRADDAVTDHFVSLLERRALCVRLATLLYAHEHGGRLPTSLDALVPEYLARVPIDPYSTDNSTLKFIADAVNPLLYSVGHNGRDDGGGDPGTFRGEDTSTWDVHEGDDVFPYHVPLRAPSPPPTTSSGIFDQQDE